MARDAKEPDMTSEKYQVSDPSVLFEDVWAEEDEATPTAGTAVGAKTRPCPTCSYEADAGDIRCPRCFTLLVTGCSGSCGTCGQRTCTGDTREG
jgi:hypothetical protein